ncbi:hypothetical protein ACHWQZ_G015422 [Mnemiopsis leidyi]
MGGEIAISNFAYISKPPSYKFEGHLFKLNLFSEVLSPADISAMNEAGLCSSIEMKYGSRQLTWERILTEKRYGNVTEFIPDECYNRTIGYFKEKLQETTKITLQETRILLNDSRTELVHIKTELTEALDDVKEQLNQKLSQLAQARKIEDVSRWDVLLTPSYLNKLFTRQLYDRLVGNWDMMEKFIGVNVTVGFVEHFRDHHEE